MFVIQRLDSVIMAASPDTKETGVKNVSSAMTKDKVIPDCEY